MKERTSSARTDSMAGAGFRAEAGGADDGVEDWASDEATAPTRDGAQASSGDGGNGCGSGSGSWPL